MKKSCFKLQNKGEKEAKNIILTAAKLESVKKWRSFGASTCVSHIMQVSSLKQFNQVNLQFQKGPNSSRVPCSTSVCSTPWCLQPFHKVFFLAAVGRNFRHWGDPFLQEQHGEPSACDWWRSRWKLAKGVKGSSLESTILNACITASKKCVLVCTLKIEGHKVRIDRYSQKYSIHWIKRAQPIRRSSKQASREAGSQTSTQNRS